MEQPKTQDPISYPKILIEGKEVEVKFRCYDAVQVFKDPTVGVEKLFNQLSAGIAHAGIEKSGEELSKMFDFADFGYVSAAVDEAMSLAVAQIKKSNPKIAQTMEEAQLKAKTAEPKQIVN